MFHGQGHTDIYYLYSFSLNQPLFAIEKEYFHIHLGLALKYYKILQVKNSSCGGGFLTFNDLIRIKAVPKVIGN